ncbi:MAG: DegV family protein, partial [Bacillota bacterium]
SGTYNCAVLAARLFEGDAPPGGRAVPVEVLDTGFGAVPEGLVAIEAARAARAGAPYAEVVRRAREVMARARLLLVVDTLEYLVRGGHVPKVAAAAARVIGLKPFIGFRDGDAVPIGAARGNEQAMLTILRRLRRDLERFSDGLDDRRGGGLLGAQRFQARPQRGLPLQLLRPGRAGLSH